MGTSNMCRRVKFSLISVVLTKGGALRNPAFELQVRVISRLYIYMYVGTDDEDATDAMLVVLMLASLLKTRHR